MKLFHQNNEAFFLHDVEQNCDNSQSMFHSTLNSVDTQKFC